MAEQAGYASRTSSALRSHVATRYVSLACILIFVLYQVRSWPPHQELVPTTSRPLSPTSLTPNTRTDIWEISSKIQAPSSFLVANPPAATTTSETTSEISSDSAFSPYPYDFETSPIEPATVLQSRIGKITSVYYDAPDEQSQAYESALLSHKEHDTLYGYKHYVQRRPAIEGIWSKMAYPIYILVQELNKAPAERLDWLFWHDADVVLLNSWLPLEAYLPPDGDRWAHINFLVTNDMGGLNDGVFFVRVCEWSLRLFAAALSFPYYRPEVNLRYESQTALGFLLEEDVWKNNSLHVPQRWFNTYQSFGDDDSVPPEWNWKHDYVEPKDLLVHLPGTGDGRTGYIHEWLERLQNERDTYVAPLNDTELPARLKYFWENDAETEDERQAVYWRRYNLLQDVGSKADSATRKGKDQLEKKLKAAGDKSDEEIENALEKYEISRKEVKKELLRDAERAMLNGTKSDNTHAS